MSIRLNETAQRVITAIVALPVYFYGIITPSFHGIPLLIVSIIISLISLYEFYQISDRGADGRAFVWPGMVAGLLINILMYLFVFGRHIERFDARILMALITLVLVVILPLQLFKRPIKGAVYSVSTTVLGLIYIVIPFSHIILMKALVNGVYYIILLNLVIMLNDSAAYFGGVYFGKHKTGFEVSPNKSWEGYFSGLLFSVIGCILCSHVFLVFFGKNLFSMIEAAIVGIVISILGNIGDLIESAFKRDGAIKDSGSIIPGHGGMMDVFDAMILVLPVFYYFLVVIGIP